MAEIIIRPVAHIYTDFAEKFGIPRQSGLVEDLCGRVVFEEEFRRPEALRHRGIFAPVADLAVFQGRDEGLSSHRAPAAPGRQRARRGLRLARAVSAQRAGHVLRQAPPG